MNRYCADPQSVLYLFMVTVMQIDKSNVVYLALSLLLSTTSTRRHSGQNVVTQQFTTVLLRKMFFQSAS